MEVAFDNYDLDRMETEPSFTNGWPPAIVKAYRKRIGFIRQSQDERDFAAMRGFGFERLKGDRIGQYSMRLNDQFRLIFTLEGESPNKVVKIVEIVDYH
jgi:proteic killer suppression protein